MGLKSKSRRFSLPTEENQENHQKDFILSSRSWLSKVIISRHTCRCVGYFALRRYPFSVEERGWNAANLPKRISLFILVETLGVVKLLMLFAFYFLLHLSRKGAVALPLVSILANDVTRASHSSLTALGEPPCSNTRSLWNIIWDCLLTTFACSWVSVHPNVPRMRTTIWSKILRRVRYMTWAIIAPELVILWAMKQRYGAHKVADQFKETGWTIEHGYMLQMGGFTLYDGKKFLGVLSIQTLEKYATRIDLNHPTLRKEAIRDKSKSDGLTKALVTIQVIWFVIQAIARHVQGLVITQLEVATIALGVLNGAMYVGWRKKPFDLQVPIPIYLDPVQEDIRIQVESKPLLDARLRGHNADDNGMYDQDRYRENPRKDSPKPRSVVYNVLFGWPRDLAKATIMDVQEMSMLTTSGSFVSFDRVSAFYALPVALTDGTKMSIGVCIMGFVFGIVHCTAWSFNFPSYAELMIWRISSVVVVAWIGASLIMLMAQLSFLDPTWNHGTVDFTDRFELEDRLWVKIAIVVRVAVFLIILANIPAYVIARLALLVEAFTTLRDLPPEAYAVVQWSSFIPHII